jgi:phenylacetate-CoA ligase
MIMENLFGKIMIPLSYYIKGDIRYTYFNEYKKHLVFSRQEIEAYQSERLKKLISHAYNTVPYYKELFDENKINPEDITCRDDLKKIPPLDKKTILTNPDKLKSKLKYKLIKSFSGGSTGNKVTIFKDKRYYELCAAISLRDLYSIGVKPGMKSAWVWGNTVQAQPLKKVIAEEISFRLNRRIMFNVFKYTDDDIEKWIKTKFNRFRPDFIYGYAGIIYDIARCIRERKIEVVPIKMIVATSERLEHREYIEDVFKCKVHDQYGCSEINSVAIEDADGIMHSSDDFVIAEVNENSEILLTALESYGMPLIRYRVGDIGFISRKTKAHTESPFNEFNIVVGRVYEILYNKNREKIGAGLIKQKIEDEDLEINEFQVVQKTFEDADLNVVKDKFTSEKGVARAGEIIKEILGCSSLKINYMDKFPAEKNGKRIAFKCMIK